MKIAHRKTLWIHSAFAGFMAVLLVMLVIINRNLPTGIVAAFIALYVAGHVFLHIKRDDLKQETVIEYILLGSAVFIVLASTLQ